MAVLPTAEEAFGEEAPNKKIPTAEEAFGPGDTPSTSSLGGFTPAIQAIAGASGVAGPIASAVNLLKNRPLARRALTEGAAMGGAAAAPTAALMGAAVGGTAVAPEVGLPLIGASVGLAGAGNVVGGAVADIMDDPQRAHTAMKILFDPTKPTYRMLLDTVQKDPNAAIQFAKSELAKAGERFTSGAIAQLFSLGLGSVMQSFSGLLPGTVSAVQKGVQGMTTPIPGAKEALTNAGYETDVSMYSKGKIVDILKGLQSKGLFSSDAAAQMVERNQVVSSKQLEDLTTELAGHLNEHIPPSELAKLVVAPKQQIGEPLQKAISERLYNEVSDAVSGPQQTFFQADPTNPAGAQIPITMRTGGTPVSTAGLKTVANEIAASPLKNLAASVSTNLKGVVNSIVGLPDTLSFEEAHGARSLLLEAARESDSPSLIAFANRGSAAIDQSMEIAAKNAGPVAYNTWRNADSFFKAGKETFNNSLTAKLIISDPGQATAIGRTLLSNGNTEQINQIKNVAQRVEDLITEHPGDAAKLAGNNPTMLNMIGQKKDFADYTMNLVRRGTLDDLIAPYQKTEPNSLSGVKINYQGILNELDPRQNSEGVAKMKTLFGQDGIDKLKDWATNGYRAAQINPGTYDRTIWWISKAVSGMAGGVLGTVGGAVIGHPYLGMLGGSTIAEGATLLGEGKIATFLLTDPEVSGTYLKGLRLMARQGSANATAGADLMIKAAKTWADNELNSRGQQ